MRGFFNLDGPFYKFGNAAWDIMIVSLLWIATSIFIFTIGASTTAMYYTLTKRATGQQTSLVGDYFKSFKQNFLQSTIVFVILTTIMIMVFLNLITIGQSELVHKNLLQVFQLVILFECFFVSLTIYPLLSRFEYKIWPLFKSAFLIANGRFTTTLLCLFTILCLFTVVYFSFILIFFVVGIYGFVTSKFFVKLFKKMSKDFDAYTYQEPDSIRDEYDYKNYQGPNLSTYQPEYTDINTIEQLSTARDNEIDNSTTAVNDSSNEIPDNSVSAVNDSSDD